MLRLRHHLKLCTILVFAGILAAGCKQAEVRPDEAASISRLPQGGASRSRSAPPQNGLGTSGFEPTREAKAPGAVLGGVIGPSLGEAQAMAAESAAEPPKSKHADAAVVLLAIHGDDDFPIDPVDAGSVYLWEQAGAIVAQARQYEAANTLPDGTVSPQAYPSGDGRLVRVG